jgi:hypothetical protein
VGTLSRVVDRLVREVGLPRADSVRIARKLNKLARSVDWATPVEDDLDKAGRKRRAVSKKPAAPKKRVVALKKHVCPRGPTAKKKACR